VRALLGIVNRGKKNRAVVKGKVVCRRTARQPLFIPAMAASASVSWEKRTKPTAIVHAGDSGISLGVLGEADEAQEHHRGP